MFEVCDFVHRDGTVCGGLYDPNVDPPVPCVMPEEEAEKFVLLFTQIPIPELVK